MRSDELYKFCDGTLTSVRRVLHDIANNLRMDYLPKRKWSNLDRIRSCIMIKAIDQQLFERRLMRNLEKFIGGREYGNDFRLLERTIRLCHIVSLSISDSVEVLRYEKRIKSENKGKVPTEIELVLEQTQLGTSYEVSVDAHRLEDSLKDGHGEVARSQEGKRSQDDDKRLCLVDDLKEVQVHIQVKPIRTS
ncbi:hypothetical protein Tco_0965480 [Tanacetum coccineum]